MPSHTTANYAVFWSPIDELHLRKPAFDLGISPTRSVSILFISVYLSALSSRSVGVQGRAFTSQHTHESKRAACCFSSSTIWVLGIELTVWFGINAFTH